MSSVSGTSRSRRGYRHKFIRKQDRNRFPETVIVQGATHGGIILDSRNQYLEFFDIPEGMTVAKLSAVSPGVCNMMNPAVSKEFSEILMVHKEEIIRELSEIANSIKKNNEKNIEKGLPEDGSEKLNRTYKKNGNPGIIKNLISIFRGKDAAFVTNLKKEAQSANPHIHQDELDYLNNLDNSYLFSVNDKRMLNKVYQRTPAEYYGDGTSSVTWDFNISVLNSTGTPDLVRLIDGRTSRRNQQISMQQILEYLNESGAINVLFVDFTCSNYSIPPSSIIPPGLEDALTIGLIENSWAGGKKSRRQKRRNNKRNRSNRIKNRKTRNRK